MKKIFLFIIFSLSVVRISAQAPQVDSLNRLLAATKEDTVKVMVLVKLGFYDQSFQHGLELAQEGLALSRKIRFEKGEAACLHQIGSQYAFISNYPIALHYYLVALKIRERIDDKQNLPASYMCIGYIYQEQGDNQNAINYYRKAEDMHTADNYRLAVIYGSFGEAYRMLNKPDSELVYYQRSYEYFDLVKDKYQLNGTLDGLGSLHLKKGNMELALGYYREAIRNGISYNDTLGLSFTYLNIARLYDGGGQKDSSALYAGKSMFCAQRANALRNVIESGKLLSRLYENQNDKEALRYLQISLAAKDSLFSRESTMQIQNMFINESEREKEIAEREKKASAERELNIHYALMALGIVTFIILFLLLSRSIIVNEKWISFFGVLGLLVVLEFINLLIHPSLIAVTHESPMLMLLALVSIASLLIPLHHRLEKWIKEKMTEKNKKIRLANAKKTIEKLEGKYLKQMAKRTDKSDKTLENSKNNESEKPSDDIISSDKPDSETQKQQTENMETHAHHLHKAPGKKVWHFFFEFLMLFLAVFCGFLAENLRENYVENERAKELAKNLYSEIFADSININQKIALRNIKESECTYFIA